MKNLIILGLVGVLLTGTLAVALPQDVYAQNQGALNRSFFASIASQIQELFLQVQALQQKVLELLNKSQNAPADTATPAPTVSIPSVPVAATSPGFVTLSEVPGEPRVSCELPTLNFGANNNSVYLLQLTLNKGGYYPEGLITGYYGSLTRAAVVRFQEANNLEKANGVVDFSTASALNKLVVSQFSECGGETPDTGLPNITVISPNGGEKFVQGDMNLVRWSGGKDTVELALVASNFNPNDDSVIGWLPAIHSPNGSMVWAASSVRNQPGSSVHIPINPGTYRILAMSQTESGERCYGVGPRNCNFDVSDVTFSIVSSAAPVVTLTANNQTFSSENVKENTITIPYNSAEIIAWKSTNAATCNLSASPSTPNWSGTVGTSGAKSTGNLTASRTFNVTCTGKESGSATASLTVNVSSPPIISSFGTDEKQYSYSGQLRNFEYTIANAGTSNLVRIYFACPDKPVSVVIGKSDHCLIPFESYYSGPATVSAVVSNDSSLTQEVRAALKVYDAAGIERDSKSVLFYIWNFPAPSY